MTDSPSDPYEPPAVDVASSQGEAPRTARDETLLARAVLQAAEAVLITSVDGTILDVNAAFERLTGFSASDLTGRPTAVLRPERYDRGVYLDLDRAMRGGRIWRGEIARRCRDGSVVVLEESVAPVSDASGAVIGFMTICRDPTGRRELEGRWRQAQKMEAIGRLAGGVAHDFNNQLTVITAYAQQLVSGLQEGDRLSKGASAIKRSADRAVALTQQLLAFSRRQLLAPRLLDVNTLLGNMERVLGQIAGGSIELVTEFGDGVVPVNADPRQFEQAILNLVANARDAMPDGGILTIRTAVVDLDRDFVQLHVGLQPGRYAMLSVSDTGCGMDADVQSHLFEPFFSTKPRGQGKGLGLATTYGFVKQSDGYIWARSSPGGGSTFTLYLPHADTGRCVAGESVPSRATIMVVEDEADVRQVLCDVLSRAGYAVIEASEGREALRLAAQHEGRIDLVITDMIMPNMTGWEVARQVAAARPETKILVISGYADDVNLEHGVSSSQVAFLAKPFAPTALRHKVLEVLGDSHGPASDPPAADSA
jgi:two-component system, cell cycle sensor histidine kinase and response regulator CckA